MRQKILDLGLKADCEAALLTLFLMQECGSDKMLTQGHWSIAADMNIKNLNKCVKELLRDGFLTADKPVDIQEDIYIPVSDYGLVICLEG